MLLLKTASLRFWARALCVLITTGCSLAAAKDIVVAQVAPFGGPLAVSGRDFNLGAIIAFDEINKVGGIGGNRIRLVSRDDGYRGAETARLVGDLIEQVNPIALIGMWGTENVNAVLEAGLLRKSEMPIVGVRSGSSSLRTNRALFHIRASYREEIQRIIEQMNTIGSTRVVVVHEDTDFGREALADAQAALAKHKLKPALVAVQPTNDLKTEGLVQNVMNTEPQSILLIANTPVAAAVIKGLRSKGSPAFIFATSTVDAEQLVSQLGTVAAGVAVAQAVPNPYKAATPVALDFKRQVVALGIDPARANFSSMEGYVAARIVAEALRRAGKDPQSKDLVRSLESLRRVDIGGFLIDFGPGQREGSRYVDLSFIGSDGRIRQ